VKNLCRRRKKEKIQLNEKLQGKWLRVRKVKIVQHISKRFVKKNDSQVVKTSTRNKTQPRLNTRESINLMEFSV
jgi:hypothetical protein